MNSEEISKTISYALRHAPHEYGLVLDSEGFTDINFFIESFNEKHGSNVLSKSVIEEIINNSSKKRFEISENKIRALYGHSVKDKIVKPVAEPPIILYHGTANKFVKKILENGLQSKERQYVHLSSDINTAIEVGKRRDVTPVILEVKAKDAFNEGIKFYQEKNKIWLSEDIPAKYIKIIE